MKSYLKIEGNHCLHSIDLDLIKKIHVRQMDRNNNIAFDLKQKNLVDAEFLTELLFNNEDYILDWITSIAWTEVAGFFRISREQWRDSKKRVVQF